MRGGYEGNGYSSPEPGRHGTRQAERNQGTRQAGRRQDTPRAGRNQGTRQAGRQGTRQAERRQDTPRAGRLPETLLSLVFPRRCPVCGEIVLPRGELICPECAEMLSPVRQPVCLCCGKQVESERMEYCQDCRRRPKSFRRNFALLNYNEAAARSMAAIKYKNKREYLDFYSRAICARFGGQILRIAPDAIVPVPVHASRLRSRGFNQAQILAEKIGGQLDIPVFSDGLKRVRKTLPQKELDPAQRLRNLQSAFAPGRLPDFAETVLLADDIYTTGSTLQTCAGLLRSMGVKNVYGVTICVGFGA